MNGFLGLFQSRKNAKSLTGIIAVGGGVHYLGLGTVPIICITAIVCVAIMATAYEDVRRSAGE